jgi:hypothetical protein
LSVPGYDQGIDMTEETQAVGSGSSVYHFMMD